MLPTPRTRVPSHSYAAFGVLQQPSLGVTQLRGLYAALLAVAIGAVAAWRARWFGSWSAAWGPNVGVGAATIFVTVFFVNRILERRAKEQARDCVEQALRRLSGDFYTLALFLAWDYAAMHGESYERPPNALRGLLAHWKAGLETRDRRWPEDLHTFAGAKAIARDLEEQISRHERVLTHAFVAAEVDGYAVGEKTLAQRLYPRLRADELLTADRGFYSWTAWDAAATTGNASWVGARHSSAAPVRTARAHASKE